MRPSISFSSRKDSNSHMQVPPASPMPTSAPPMQNGAAPESSVNQLCVSCYGLCAAVTRIVEQLPHQVIIKEDCRKSSRLLKRVEVLISDTHPYLSASPDVAGAYQDELLQALQEIKAGMVDVFNTVSLVASKGPLATYMQGDRILSSFTAAAGRLDVALGLLARAAEPHKLLPEETQEELCIVRSLLQRARFDPSPDHAAVMASFRDGVQTMQSGFGQVMGAVAKIVRSITCGSDSLSREGLQHAKDELVSEHEYITALGDPYNDSIHLRVMLDILRVHNQGPTDTPLAFICPICHQIMQDPVVLQETGHSYERKAIENWFNKGHHYCPRTGKALSRKLCVIDNPNLRDAINLWKQDSALNTSFRPVMQSLVNLKQYEAELAQLKAQHLAEAQQQAVAAAEKNAAQQAALRGSAAPEPTPSQAGSLHSRSSGSMQPSRSRDMGALHDGTPYSVVRHVHIAPTPTVYGASEPAAAQQGSSAVQGGVGEEQAGQPQQQQQQQQEQQQEQHQQQQGEQQEQGQEQQQPSEADQLMAPLPNQEQLQQAQDLQSPALSESSMTQKSHVAIPELGGAGVGSPHSSTARAVLFSTSAHARSHGAQGPPSQASQASQEEGEKGAFKPARLQADHLPPSSTMDAAMNAAMCSPFAPPPSVGSSTAYMGSRVDEDVLQMDPNQAAPSVCGSEAVPPPPASEDGMSLQGLRVSGTGDAASVYAPSASATATDGPLGRTASSLAGDGASLGGGGSVVGDPAWGAPDAGGGSIAGSAAGDVPQGGDSGNHVQEGVELKGA